MKLQLKYFIKKCFIKKLIIILFKEGRIKTRRYYILLAFLIIIGIIILLNFPYDQKNENLPSYATAEELKEIEEIYTKIEEVKLTKKIIYELIKSGYSPQRRIQYTVYSSDEKVLTISLPSKDIDDKNILKINDIINTISKENGLNTFSVEIIEIGKGI